MRYFLDSWAGCLLVWLLGYGVSLATFICVGLVWIGGSKTKPFTPLRGFTGWGECFQQNISSSQHKLLKLLSIFNFIISKRRVWGGQPLPKLAFFNNPVFY